MMQTQDTLSSSPVILPLGIRRFEFPELSAEADEEGAHGSAKVIWPECHCAATTQAAAEAAESIRWRLPKKQSTILAVTSPLDEDGKDQLLVALVPELAKRVDGDLLVVDAECSQRALLRHLTFVDQSAANAASLIYPTNLRRLNVMPISVEGQRFHSDWIDEWRDRWPLVLVNTPSLEHRRTGPLISICDGTYLVVRLGGTARRAVSEAAQVIRGHGGRLLGCIATQ